MNTKVITALVLSSGLFTAVSFAQTAPGASAPAVSAPAAAAVAPDQILYAPQLPAVSTLTSAAAAQGIAIKQISQTDREISVTYQLSSGQTRTVSYQLLPSGGQNAVTAPASVPAVVPAPSAAPTVVYAVTDPYPYYTYSPYYGYWYPPVALRVGFGWGFHGGHWR